LSNVPASGTFNADDDLTQGELRQALEDERNVLAEIAGSGDASGEQALTIASGVITPAAGRSRFLRIDTQGAAATDDLDTIAQTNVPDQSFVFLAIADASRVVVVKHLAGGTGQISLSGAMDLALNQTAQVLWLKRNGSSFVEIGRFGREKEHQVGGSGEPAFQNSWTGSSVRYWKDENGIVRLSGSASHASLAASPSTIFTLPSGYRPATGGVSMIAYTTVAAAYEVNVVLVNDTGTVQFVRPAGAPSSVAVAVGLAQVQFRATQ